jgi:hypothetical protein
VRSVVTRALVTGGLLAIAMTAPSAGVASRQPTLKERGAITRALPPSIRRAPVACSFVDIRISTRNARYARATPRVLNVAVRPLGCIRYAVDGFFILRKAAGWRVVYEGSDPPPCRLRVPRDLVTCLKR